MTVALLPTRKAEAYRYTDLDALAGVWPVTREEILVPSGTRDRLSIVELGDGSVARHLVVTLEAAASFDLHLLNAGSAFGRIAVEARLGEGASFSLGAAQLGSGAQTLEIVTEVSHDAPNAVSRQVVRSVLGGQATGTYLGRVAVARGSDGTDAEQSVRAMLLDRTATANAKPELEIFADDVKCAHGCAVGELDAMGLFYLESRGLTPPQAKRLMLQAFIAEAFTGAADEQRLTEAALRRLEAML
ncbi:MAG: SufD family Fe-S cluster assembly protein [Sphingomonadales bacterium]|nr:SufD family Fe-S cluster assembly protein [Sphingomonadales bacterium]